MSRSASLAPRRGFDTICALIPEIRKRLGIVGESGLVVTRLISFQGPPGIHYHYHSGLSDARAMPDPDLESDLPGANRPLNRS